MLAKPHSIAADAADGRTGNAMQTPTDFKAYTAQQAAEIALVYARVMHGTAMPVASYLKTELHSHHGTLKRQHKFACEQHHTVS